MIIITFYKIITRCNIKRTLASAPQWCLIQRAKSEIKSIWKSYILAAVYSLPAILLVVLGWMWQICKFLKPLDTFKMSTFKTWFTGPKDSQFYISWALLLTAVSPFAFAYVSISLYYVLSWDYSIFHSTCSTSTTKGSNLSCFSISPIYLCRESWHIPLCITHAVQAHQFAKQIAIQTAWRVFLRFHEINFLYVVDKLD